MNLIIKTLIFAIVMVIIDVPWIKFVMSKLYKNIFTIKISVVPAILAYLSMIIVYPFIISKFKSINAQIKIAFVLGLAIFGCYGFTLAAIYPKYPMKTAIAETAWGAILYSITCYISYHIIKLLERK